ncbi:DNA-binding protein [Nocardioides marmoriginsengisoli]|uniref:DNA-binding protein n=1 Tax=Nocardioides marmoriginsengisoli TaxID=661483 RepID=A0A3N0CCN3_9ACTN|nr:helix-turn-helix domain-containing protein [Nocardioides marmoriginsengisoli]RNL61011.1 DNA-binding protein [Nocardioides marmoriginsengisoli]
MPRAIPTVQRRLLGYPEVATYLGISVRAAKELAHEGKLLKVLIGHRVLFDVVDVDHFIEQIKRAS